MNTATAFFALDANGEITCGPCAKPQCEIYGCQLKAQYQGPVVYQKPDLFLIEKQSRDANTAALNRLAAAIERYLDKRPTNTPEK